MTTSQGPSAVPASPGPGSMAGAVVGPDAGVGRVTDRNELPDRVWTVPNALSVLRLLGVPLFLWLLLGPQEDGWAVVVLMVSGVTDWADGKLARVLGQSSRLGALLDPAADRLYIIATLIAFVLRDVVPLWVVAVLVGREVVLGLMLLVLRHHRYEPLQVHYLGKAATFNLLYAFPLLLLADDATGAWLAWVQPFAYAFTIWGGVLYVLAGVLYVVQVAGIVRTERALARGTARSGAGAPARPAP
ncbi:CDP-alcohol phosphatidyltransferase family protein [Geodermatophilus sp. SYSU D01036]